MKKPDVGTHEARPAAGFLSTMGKDNKPCVSVEFVLADDPNCGDIWIGWLGDKIGNDKKTNTERTVQTLRTCGWEGDDLSDIQFPDSARVEIVVDDEEWENESGKVFTNRRIQFVNAVGGGGVRPKRMDAAAAKRFAERLKTKVGGKPNGSPPRPPAEEEEGDSIGDDNIPF